ncbi:MAG: hypothetical protein EOP00_18205 [Pedobacter sp.]|nr:MAG: hypothetical protein EOP00_18205 [Pedobacter sp.]
MKRICLILLCLILVYPAVAQDKPNNFSVSAGKILNQKNAKGDWQYIYPFADKTYVLALQHNINPPDSSPIAKNTNIYFGKVGAKIDKVFWKEQAYVHVVKDNVRYEDYNNDGIKDLMLFVTTGGRGANELYHLYLKDERNKTLRKVHGFDEIANPSYQKKYRLIVGYSYAGTNSYSLYRIKNNKVYQIGKSFEDSEDLDLDLKIEQVLKIHSK